MQFSAKQLTGKSVDESLRMLKTSFHGLESHEVIKRHEEFGKNTFTKEQRFHTVTLLLSQFTNPLIIILLFASVITYATGEIVESVIILAMIFMSAVLNFFQEYRASAAAKKLQEGVALKCTVIRNGKEEQVLASRLTIGDIVKLNAGDIIPADARILQAKDFFVNQSSLTGESLPVEKNELQNGKNTDTLSDMHNIVYMGTSAVSGTATVAILAIGNSTELGSISKTLDETAPENEFTRGAKNFSVFILKITILFVCVIFFINAYLRHDFFESLLFAVAVAVGLTPELLPMIMSITMSKGSINMEKKGVIVKKLTAIPTFGSLNILCTDKTGTLTEDTIVLVKYVNNQGNESEHVLLYTYLNSYFQTGITNPLDQAVLNFKQKPDIKGYSKVDEIPFDFVRKRLSIIVEHNGKKTLLTKGAPEEIFPICKYYHIHGEPKPLKPENKAHLKELYHHLSAEGYRVLAVAAKHVNSKDKYEKDDEYSMELVGFTAFLDPPKQGVKKVLADLEKMGIEIKIVTGDNELVTKRICEDVGLPIKGVLLGSHTHSLTDDALAVRARKTTIFARFSPNEKNRVIRVLQKAGNVVGYMGDGINDAPSLHTADVGISVSNAVDVAKESASMIITHKSLRVLKDGIIEGRKTFGNSMKYVLMGVSANFGNMFSVLGAILFLPFLPMTPIQILLNNLLYDTSQITIPSDSVDDEFTKHPKHWDIQFVKKYMVIFGSISSLFDFLTFYVLYGVWHASAGVFQTGWFMESLATQTLIIHVIRTKKIPFLQSRPSWPLLVSTLCIVILGWVLPYTVLGSKFGFVPLPLHVLLCLGGIIVAYLITTEGIKRWAFRGWGD